MDIYLLMLRLIHIGGGVFWVGAALFLVFYVAPTVAALGPEGDRFMDRLMGSAGAAKALTIASAAVSVTGILLFWRASGYLKLGWILSAPGLAITIGSLAGLASFVIGTTIIEPTIRRLGVVGAALSAAGGAPSETQRTEFGVLQRRLTAVTRVDAYILIVSVAGMAIARSL